MVVEGSLILLTNYKQAAPIPLNISAKLYNVAPAAYTLCFTVGFSTLEQRCYIMLQ